ncbi:putative membrane protein YvbJ [Bacillus fengqiuensis]|nr:putative membrane protein YvbJ [Bacillus fengqiuensis]
MIFCKECGEKIGEGMRFCNECGTPIQQNGGVSQATQPSYSAVQAKMTKKTKRMLAAIGAAAVVLFGAYKLAENLTDKNRMIEQFETALNSGDENKIADLLHSTDSKLELNEKSVTAFVKYFKAHPEERSDLIESLKEQSAYYEKVKGKTSEVVDSFAEEMIDDGIVTLKENGKTALFFDKYTLDIEPVYITVSTNYKDTELYVDGKKIGKATKPDFEKTYGPYLPGVYKMEARLKTNFVDLVKKEDVSLINSGNKAEVDMYLEGKEVTVDLNAESSNLNTKLLINGKDVGVNLVKNPTFGPVLTDGSMKLQVQADLPWGKTKTVEMPIEGSEMEVNFGSDQAVQTRITDSVVSYTREWMEAYTTGAVSKLTKVTDDYKTVIQNDINEAKESELYFKGQYLGTEVDLDTMNIYYEEDRWRASLEVLERYNSDFYYPGETPSLEENEEVWRYELVFDEKAKKWLVNSAEHSSYWGSDHVKKVEESNPKMHQTAWSNSTPEPQDEEASIMGSDRANELTSFVEEYMHSTIAAVNSEDFSLAEAYLDPDGKKYKEQKEYTAYLNKKKIKEELLNLKIKDIKKLDASTYEVSTYEEYKLMYSDGTEKYKNFNSVHKIKELSNGNFGVNELVSTKEVAKE